jgi:hypothetical protein
MTGRSPVRTGIHVGLEEDPRHFPHGRDDHWPLWDAMRGADTWPVSQQPTRANQVDQFKRGVPEFIDQAARKEEVSMAVGGSAGEKGGWTLDIGPAGARRTKSLKEKRRNKRPMT